MGFFPSFMVGEAHGDVRSRFAALVDEVRVQTAKTLLADRTIALSEIAFLLGYSEQSAFTRAFERWTGATPALTRPSFAG